MYGTNPLGYHLTAVALHGVSTLAVFGIALKATPAGTAGAAFAALLFALLPIHSESVAWINGSKVDVLPSALYLVGFLGFVWFRSTRRIRFLGLAALGFLGSLMSKELAVTFPAMVVCYDLFRRAASHPAASGDPARRWWQEFLVPYLGIGGLLGGYLALRGTIFASVLHEDQWVFNVREAFASAGGFHAEGGRLWETFAQLQEFNYRQPFLDFPPMAAGVVVGTLLTWTGFAVGISGNRREVIAWTAYFAAVWYLIACLPLLMTYHSVRHLYLPAAGPCIAIACLAATGWNRSWRRARLAWVASAMVVLMILAGMLWRQNGNWIRASDISEKLAQELPAALEATPREALVILWAPIDPNRAYVWPWVMPFALQEPFVSRDLYSEFRLIEFPVMYCCPVEQWWERKRAVLLAALTGDPEQEVAVHRLSWSEEKGVLGRLQISLTRKQLRARIEGILGGPIESDQTIQDAVATKLMGDFMDLTAQGN